MQEQQTVAEQLERLARSRFWNEARAAVARPVPAGVRRDDSHGYTIKQAIRRRRF